MIDYFVNFVAQVITLLWSDQGVALATWIAALAAVAALVFRR